MGRVPESLCHLAPDNHTKLRRSIIYVMEISELKRKKINKKGGEEKLFR
jgi:hypothetical protein